jgi:hypothetical protein
MNITFDRRPFASAGYRVLSAIDLGGDAASLGGSRWFKPRWSEPLEKALRSANAEERIAIQLAPLWFDDLDRLSSDPRAGSSESWRAFVAAMREVVPREPAAHVAQSRIEAAERELARPLERLRGALWSDPPPLEIFDCEALGASGRGLLGRSRHRIAVSLREPLASVLFQIFHELVHGVSDREVRARFPGADRDTRKGSPGHALHVALERHALDYGEEVVAREAPAWLEAYRKWRARFGL